MIIILCKMETDADKKTAYLDEIKNSGSIEAARSESGNVSYDLMCPLNDDCMYIVERWTDFAAIKKHLKSKNYLNMISIGKKYSVKNTVKMYNAEEM